MVELDIQVNGRIADSSAANNCRSLQRRSPENRKQNSNFNRKAHVTTEQHTEREEGLLTKQPPVGGAQSIRTCLFRASKRPRWAAKWEATKANRVPHISREATQAPWWYIEEEKKKCWSYPSAGGRVALTLFPMTLKMPVASVTPWTCST